MDLYKIVIENYSSLEDPRAKDYQDRMKALFSLPNVKNAISAASISRPNRRSTEMTRDLSIERIADKALIRHSSENHFATEIVQNDLKAQNDLLNVRVMNRRRSSKGFGLFELEVEKVVERFVEEKERLIASDQATKQNLQQLESNKKFEINKIRRRFLNL